MAKADASEVARLLREYGQRTALKGGNPYRAKAHPPAAETLAALTEPLETLVREDRLQEIPGVGAAITEIIKTLHRTGTHPTLHKNAPGDAARRPGPAALARPASGEGPQTAS